MAQKRYSHAYMIVGPDTPDRRERAENLAASILCPEENAPCGVCRHCRKLQAGVHPDRILVERQNDDRGRLRQEIVVGQVRAITADAFIAPNEADQKVYIIQEADRMNREAQNALLKALEDPPGHACFILCTASADALLPTVRSRCVRTDTGPHEAQALAPLSELTEAYLALLAGNDPASMAQFCFLRSGMSREEADQFLMETEDALCDVLCRRRSVPGLTSGRIFFANEIISKARIYLQRNLSAKQVFGLLAAEFDLGVN